MKRWSATCLAVGLIGLALPGAASAAETCSDVHARLNVKGLSLSAGEQQAMTLKRICVERGGQSLHVTATFGGDVSSLLGTGHLAKAAVAVLAYGAPAKKAPKKKKHRGKRARSAARRKRKKKASGPTPVVVYATGALAAAKTVASPGLTVAVVREGATVEFFASGRSLASARRVEVRAVILGGKRRKPRAYKSESLLGAALQLERALTLEVAGLVLPRDLGPVSCGNLKELIDKTQAVVAELEAELAALQAKNPHPFPMSPEDDQITYIRDWSIPPLQKWLKDAQAYYAKHCKPKAPPPAIAPVPPGTFPVGSDLSDSATYFVSLAQDWVAWLKAHGLARATRDAPSISVPADGQILSFKIKGKANPSGKPGDPGPLTTFHLQDLRPQPDGSVIVDHSSQPFNLPTTGDPNQINQFLPTNFCVHKGDYLGFNTEGGFDPTYYPSGVPFQVFSSPQPGWTTDLFSKHNGTGNGSQFTGIDQPNVELLMQATEGTGASASGLCPGGTKTS